MPIAYELHKPFVPVRKKGKLPLETISKEYDLEYGSAVIEMHKDSIKPGQKVVIVDDLIATGGTIEAAIQMVEELGGEVVKVIFFMELAGLKGRERLKNYDVDSVIIYEGNNCDKDRRREMLEKFFKLKENKTTVRNEVIGGVTTFMTMAYILAVNPSMLSAAGMDSTAVLLATALASFLGTIIMALLANYPFALAPGMGLNAYFAYTVCGSMGYSWQLALMAVFVEGLVFIVLSLTNVREAIFNAIPSALKKGVSAGIGLFIAFVGLQGAHLVVAKESTLVTYVDFTGTINHEGICAILAFVGLIITAILYVKNVKGSILIGIIATWILGMICQAAGIYKVDVDAGFYSLYPTLGITDFTALSKTFGQVFKADFSGSWHCKLYRCIILIPFCCNV